MASNRVRNWWKWVIGTLLILLATIQIFVSFVVGPAIRTTVSRTVSQNTRNLYSLQIQSVDWSIFRRSFSMKGLSLAYDQACFDSLAAEGHAKPFLFTAQVPEVEITFEDLFRIIRHRDAHLKSLTLHQPEIQVRSFPEFAGEGESFRPERIYQLISQFVNTLHIERLRITGGTLTFNPSEDQRQNSFSAREISFEILNFQIDSTTVLQHDRPFFADQITARMNIEDYIFFVPDSSYSIRAGKIEISSLTGEITAENIQVQPVISSQNHSPLRESFDIYIPRLVLQGVPIYTAWFDRKLDMALVRIVEPVVSSTTNPSVQIPSGKKDRQVPIVEKLLPWFGRIATGSLTVEGGKYFHLKNTGDTTLSVEGVDMTLSGVKLDSGIYQPDPNRILFSDNISVEYTRLRTRLSRQNYTLTTGATSLSTGDGVLSVRNIDLRATSQKFAEALVEGGDVISLTVPRASFYGLDLPGVWHERILSVGWVEIYEPLAELINRPQVERELVDSLAKSNLYSLVEDELRAFSIRNFFVKGGKFNFNTSDLASGNEFAASDINVHIQNFQLSPDTTLRRKNPWYADDIAVKANIADYLFILPDSSYAIRAASIGISTADSAIFADSVSIIPRDTTQKGRQHIHGFIPSVYLSGLDVRQVWVYQTLIIDSLHLSHPQIGMHNPEAEEQQKSFLPSLENIDWYAAISQRLHSLEIHNIQIDSAHFTRQHTGPSPTLLMEIPVMSVTVSDFRLEPGSRIGPENMLYSRDIQVKIDGITQPLPDSIHTLQTGAISFSTARQKLNISDIKISPNPSAHSPEKQNRYRFETPRLIVEGVNSFELLEEKILNLEGVTLYDPKLSMDRYPQLEKTDIDSLAKSDLYQLIAGKLESLRIHTFLVMNGFVRLNENNPLSGNAFTARDIVILITNFQLDPAARTNTGNPFYADDIDIGMNIRDYSIMLADSSYTIRIGDIGISTADSSIIAEEIEITPNRESRFLSRAGQQMEIFIPSARLAGLRANEIYFDRVLNLRSLRLSRPRIALSQSPPSAEQPRDINLYAMVEKFFHRVSLDTFSIERARFEQFLPPGDTTRPVVLHDFSFNLYRFVPDPLEMMRPGRMLFSDDFDFLIPTYTIPLKDSLYLLDLHNLSINSALSKVTIDSATFASNYNIFDYVVANGYAIDYFDLRTGKIEIEDADLYAMLQNRDLIAGEISIENPNLMIQKDRRFSPDPDRRPPAPQELLRSLSFRLAVDSIRLSRGVINYFERVDRVARPGYIYLTSVSAVLKNATNQFPRIVSGKKQEMTLRGQAMIKDEGKLEISMYYPLGDTTNPYTMEGTAGPMDLTTFNSILEPAAGVKVASGRALDMAFRIRGTAHNARGKMWFEYENLKVSVVEEKEKEDEENQVSQRGFATAMANALVVRSRNPKRKFLRVGRIEYEADPSKIFVAHWLRALVSGVKSSIGMEGKDENIERED
ncbi:MAG: hypothetical protein R3C61_00665 [Bacteroidia bacterium]